MDGVKMLLQFIQRPRKVTGYIVLMKPTAGEQVCFLSVTVRCIVVKKTLVRGFTMKVVPTRLSG